MRRILTLSVVVLVLAGCGPRRHRSGAMTGKLTYKAEPVKGVALILYSTSNTSQDSITVPVSPEGDFRIADIPPGEYKVVVQGTSGASEVDPAMLKRLPPEKQAEAKAKLDAMKTQPSSRFPDKYKDPFKTPERLTVTNSDQVHNIELTD